MTSYKSVPLACLALLSIGLLSSRAYGVAVMSVDLGSENMKIAIVTPGVPMEIALNKESKRKTPVTISFRDGERTFGEEALNLGTRFPQSSFSYILDLVGKDVDNPIVELFKRRFPYYKIEADPERNTVLFRIDQETTYSPEELLAQLLSKAKEFAETSAGQKIKEAVITVPGFFNQAERLAMLQAAELADLKVLQLINDYSAVALNYGIFHSKEINDTAHYIMFYDMGASSTSATIVGYQNVKTKERGFLETHPQVQILGVGYDRTLGGLEMQLRLRDYLAGEFDAMKKTKNSVLGNPRAMAKLLKEAGRVKTVLSANADHYAQIEGLLDEQDFRLQVTRDKFEELCADLFERVAKPIETALEIAALPLDVISQVVLVGAGTRVPKVQEKLQAFVKTELSKNINTDEAAVLGAVYKAAELSQGFKVKKFINKDAVLFPIQIVFERTVEDQVKQVRRMLFGRSNAYPQKKIITFNKHDCDFSFYINYAELEYLSEMEILAIGNLNISKISLTGVSEALVKLAMDGAEIKGIKAHFALDESGILKMVYVELVGEKTSAAEDEEEEEGSDNKASDKAGEPAKEDVKPVHEEPDKKESDEKAKATNETKPGDKVENKTEKAAKDKKPTVVAVKEPIAAQELKFGPQVLSKEELIVSKEKLKDLDTFDELKAKREGALHNLESFVIDLQIKLELDEYKRAAVPEDIENILKVASEISEWLYEEGFDASAETYEQKHAELQKLTDELYERVFEHRERPEALKGMLQMINGSRHFLANMRVLNVSSEIFTQVEFETLERIINETQEYYDLVVKATSETPAHMPVLYKVRDIANRMALLDREVKYLVNKAKIWRPKEAPAANVTEETAEKTSEAESGPKKDKDDSETIETEEDEAWGLPEAEQPPVGADDTDEHSEL